MIFKIRCRLPPKLGILRITRLYEKATTGERFDIFYRVGVGECLRYRPIPQISLRTGAFQDLTKENSAKHSLQT